MAQRNVIRCATSGWHLLRVGNRQLELAFQARIASAMTALELGAFV